VIPVRHVIPNALAVVLEKAPLTPEKVAFAWRGAVGPAVDHVTTVELHGATLTVHARDEAWRRELEKAAGTIRTRMNAVLGDGVVRGLDVRLD